MNQRLNRSMLGKLALFALMMFGFGWAMIPLYNAICEATGLRVLTRSDSQAREVVRNTQVDKSRTVTVEFDANSHGPWRFKPQVSSVQAHPGELMTVEYELVNTVGHEVAGQAIPELRTVDLGTPFPQGRMFLLSPAEARGE